MATVSVPQVEQRAVLTKALLNAGKELGLSQTIIGHIIGKDRTTLSRGVDPNSKAGELAKLFLRCYRSLYVLVGGNPEDMKHWIHTKNRHTGGVPFDQIQTVTGLSLIVSYLDAMRGKI